MLKGGRHSFWVILARELEVLATMKGVHKKFPHLKRMGGGGQTDLPCLERGGGCAQTGLNPKFSHFFSPLPVNNDRSLISAFLMTCGNEWRGAMDFSHNQRHYQKSGHPLRCAIRHALRLCQVNTDTPYFRLCALPGRRPRRHP